MSMPERSWLITGGCGFIGTQLISALRKNLAIGIRVIDNLSVGTEADLSSVTEYETLDSRMLDYPEPHRAVQLLKVDISEADVMVRAARGMQVVIHLAANTGVGPSVENPRLDCLTNVVGMLNVLEAARHARVQRFVFASSGAPIGEVEPPIHEELPAHPVSPYGASKLAGEGYCSAYARTFGLETVALRFGNVYGPGSGHKNSVVAKFIRDSIEEGVLRINGNGSQTRDFIFVNDLIEAIILAADAPAISGEIFQIATQRETTVNEIADILRAIIPKFGYAVPQLQFDAPRLGDVRRNFSNTAKARHRLGWQARTPLDQGIETTVRWFLSASRPSYSQSSNPNA